MNWLQKYQHKKLRKQYPELESILNEVHALSESVGCNEFDYVYLYHFLMQLKPTKVLECGTGRSTLLLAHALNKLEKDGNIKQPLLISMESIPSWHQEALSHFPFKRFPFVKILYSPIETYHYSFVLGTSYKELPEEDFDFVFVDGPDQAIGPLQNDYLCNMDFIKVVSRSSKPVYGIVDNRKSTVLSYKLLFGDKKTKYYVLPKSGLGFVSGVTKHDFILGDKQKLKAHHFDRLVKSFKHVPFKVPPPT